jgi:glutamyl-tRNA reductase
VSQHGAAELLAFGISHKTAPVAVRERLALTTRDAARLVQELVARPSIHEAVAISTCNRTEVYLVTDDQVQAEADLLGLLARRAAIRPTELAGVVYSPRNCDAARQLFRVVCGLESMVVGEAEVQGQVKRAYEAALEAGTTGPLTNRLFTAALQTGKRVRTETALGSSRTSVASVAVDLASQVVGELARRDVIIIGAGETSETTAKALAARGVRTIFVANRHAARAHSMAERVGGRVSSLHDLPELLETADMVVASTSSPHAIVEAEEVEVVMRRRSDRPLVLIDIAVPRDIDPACADVPRRHAVRHRRPAGRRGAQHGRPRGRPRPRGGRRGGRDPAVRPLAGADGRAPHRGRAARARGPDRRPCPVGERGALGVRLAQGPRPRRRHRPRGDAAAAP